MKTYVGIDLGTTNSAVCTYDGGEVRIWKSPEQNDVTPSAIYIDRRGNRYYGQKAYQQAPYYPDDSAMLFKRYMGTDTRFRFKSAGIEMTPEECSAEILRVLFGYLPEEVRGDPDTAVVITVPAAFNQMKKDATVQAARLAGFGRVAIMQEPVAAIMSVMRAQTRDGVFLVYDLGGGTFDVSLAENVGGRVNLLSHGGIEMCGGRDLDRMMFAALVVPWLKKNFRLPEDFTSDPRFSSLCRLAQRAAELAKIELSAREDGCIALGEAEARCADLDGSEIYIDIPVTRADVDGLLNGILDDTVRVVRETLSKAGLTAGDVEKVVFVGGPTNYKPLRDKVSAQLGVAADTQVDPMTAVAVGAAIYAESIDWADSGHHRKASDAELKTDLNVTLRYTARTPDARAGLVVLADRTAGLMVEVVSLESGWSSGRAPLKNGLQLDLPLDQNGENRFRLTVYDSFGKPVPLREDLIVITRTMATVGAIPASHSICVEVMDRLGGAPVLEYLVREGEPLPHKGSVKFRAGQSLRPGSASSINIKLWEGEIPSPISDNRFIGVLKIMGTDFEDGVIPIGAEIECGYEMDDSGAIRLSVSVPCIGASFDSRNFYSRQEGQADLSDTDKLSFDAQRLMERIDAMTEKVADPRLASAREKAAFAAGIASAPFDPEEVQKAANDLLEAKKLVAGTRRDHLREIRELDLSVCLNFFERAVRKYAKPYEASFYDNLANSAQRAILNNEPNFENQLQELKQRNFSILWRKDWFVIDRFNSLIRNPNNFSPRGRFEELRKAGQQLIQTEAIDELREVCRQLWAIEIARFTGESMYETANIVKG